MKPKKGGGGWDAPFSGRIPLGKSHSLGTRKRVPKRRPRSKRGKTAYHGKGREKRGISF